MSTHIDMFPHLEGKREKTSLCLIYSFRNQRRAVPRWLWCGSLSKWSILHRVSVRMCRDKRRGHPEFQIGRHLLFFSFFFLFFDLFKFEVITARDWPTKPDDDGHRVNIEEGQRLNRRLSFPSSHVGSVPSAYHLSDGSKEQTGGRFRDDTVVCCCRRHAFHFVRTNTSRKPTN